VYRDDRFEFLYFEMEMHLESRDTSTHDADFSVMGAMGGRTRTITLMFSAFLGTAFGERDVAGHLDRLRGGLLNMLMMCVEARNVQ